MRPMGRTRYCRQISLSMAVEAAKTPSDQLLQAVIVAALNASSCGHAVIMFAVGVHSESPVSRRARLSKTQTDYVRMF